MFRSFIGLDVAEFDSLFSRIELVFDENEKKRLFRRDRKHEIGAGHPVQASRSRIDSLMLLMYYRTYVTSLLLGFTVGPRPGIFPAEGTERVEGEMGFTTLDYSVGRARSMLGVKALLACLT